MWSMYIEYKLPPNAANRKYVIFNLPQSQFYNNNHNSVSFTGNNNGNSPNVHSSCPIIIWDYAAKECKWANHSEMEE